MDNFSYNGVVLSFVKTVACEDHPEMDPTGTNRIYHRYRLTVQGVIAYGITPSNSGEQPAETYARIQDKLLQPRKPLSYTVGNKTMIAVPTPPDAANGPKPVSVTCILVSPGSLTIEYTVEFCVDPCGGSQARSRGYASNMYAQTEEFDELGMCTLTTSGLLIARSDLNKTPSQLRGVVVPRVRLGYQRTSSRYVFSEDGLRLQYEFRDTEFYRPPPFGSLRASGSFKIMSNAFGASWTGLCEVRLEGSKGTPKQFLQDRAEQIIASRLSPLVIRQANVANQEPNWIDRNIGQIVAGVLTGGIGAPLGQLADRLPAGILQADRPAQNVASAAVAQEEISEELWGNSVKYSIKANLDPKKVMEVRARGGLFNYSMPGVADVNQPAIAPAIRGNNGLLEILAAEFQDPCVAVSAGLSSLPVSLSAGRATGPDYPSVTGVPAQIGIGQVAGSFGGLPRASSTNFDYEIYDATLTFLWDGNLTSLVPTDEDKPREVESLGPPTLDVVLDFVMERIGAKPEIPQSCPPPHLCTLFKLMKRTTATKRPQPTPGGGFVHSASGRYTYAVLDPSRVLLVEPIPPSLQSSQPTQPIPFPTSQNVIWRDIAKAAADEWRRCCETGAPGPSGLPNLELSRPPGGATLGTTGGSGIPGPFTPGLAVQPPTGSPLPGPGIGFPFGLTPGTTPPPRPGG